MNEIIRSDLQSLWDNSYVARARALNLALGRDQFDANTMPMYFTGNQEARIAMVMLNPGHHDPQFDFAATVKNAGVSLEEYIPKFINSLVNFGGKPIERPDNFDLKQAAFLHSLNDPVLNIPYKFWEDPGLKITAWRNVLLNKLQLEFIPYSSQIFGGMLDTPGQATKNFRAFEPYLESLLETIFSVPRDHVIFCSRQFETLFSVSAAFTEWKGVFSVSSPRRYKDGGLSLSFSKAGIQYRDHRCQAIIARSFPSRALPNAYEKMNRYGAFCFSEFISS